MYQKYTKTTADKKKLPLQGSLILLAEKPGFEPGLRGYRTTPLAGAPLQPLEYFSIPILNINHDGDYIK